TCFTRQTEGFFHVLSGILVCHLAHCDDPQTRLEERSIPFVAQIAGDREAFTGKGACPLIVAESPCKVRCAPVESQEDRAWCVALTKQGFLIQSRASTKFPYNDQDQANALTSRSIASAPSGSSLPQTSAARRFSCSSRQMRWRGPRGS